MKYAKFTLIEKLTETSNISTDTPKLLLSIYLSIYLPNYLFIYVSIYILLYIYIYIVAIFAVLMTWLNV